MVTPHLKLCQERSRRLRALLLQNGYERSVDPFHFLKYRNKTYPDLSVTIFRESYVVNSPHTKHQRRSLVRVTHLGMTFDEDVVIYLKKSLKKYLEFS